MIPYALPAECTCPDVQTRFRFLTASMAIVAAKQVGYFRPRVDRFIIRIDLDFVFLPGFRAGLDPGLNVRSRLSCTRIDT